MRQLASSPTPEVYIEPHKKTANMLHYTEAVTRGVL